MEEVALSEAEVLMKGGRSFSSFEGSSSFSEGDPGADERSDKSSSR